MSLTLCYLKLFVLEGWDGREICVTGMKSEYQHEIIVSRVETSKCRNSYFRYNFYKIIS